MEDTSRLAVQKDLDGVSTLVYLPARKRPLTHSEYSFGWRIYKAVYLESHPDEVDAMLQYENDVCNLAGQGLDWARYDEEFRKGKEIHNYPLNVMRPDLDRLLYSVGISSFRPSQNFQSSQNFRPSHSQSFRSTQCKFEAIQSRFGDNTEARKSYGEPSMYIQKGFCYQYHIKGQQCLFDTQCRYNHTCFKCFESHPN